MQQLNSTINIDTVKFGVDEDMGRIFDLGAVTQHIVEKRDTRTGEVQFQGVNRTRIPGNFGPALCVRNRDFHRRLEVEGSPGHYLFGQNIFTSADLHGLCLTALKGLYGELGLRRSTTVKAKCDNGDIDLSRVDLACNFELGSEEQVMAILWQLKQRFLEDSCMNRNSSTWTTLCPDEGRHYSIAFYAKGAEMRLGSSHRELANRQEMIEATRRILRVELRLRGDLKKLGLEKVSRWDEKTAEDVFWRYINRLGLENTTVGEYCTDEMIQLDPKLRPLYFAYKAGAPQHVLKLMYSISTFKRHRAALRAHGINIEQPNVVNEGLGTIRDVISPARAIATLPSWIEKAGLAPFALVQPSRKS